MDPAGSTGPAERLFTGHDPGAAGLIGRELRDGSVAGFDPTFKAPNSVSALFGAAE